jgi:hypothetical protein
MWFPIFQGYRADPEHAKWLQEAVGVSEDGPHFVHALKLQDMLVRERLTENPQADFSTDPILGPIREMRDLIQQRLEEARDNPRHFEKVRWFANYWNETVEAPPKLRPIVLL